MQLQMLMDYVACLSNWWGWVLGIFWFINQFHLPTLQEQVFPSAIVKVLADTAVFAIKIRRISLIGSSELRNQLWALDDL